MKERKYKEDYVLESRIDERGRERRVAVYRGKWYSLDMDAAARRGLCLHAVLSALCFAAFYFAYMKLSTPSAGCLYVLPVAACASIPTLYWFMGVFSLWRAPERMTTSQKESSVGRVLRSAIGCAVFMGMAFIGDCVFMLVSAQERAAAEFPGLALLLCAAAAPFSCFLRMRPAYNRMRTVSAPDGESWRRK